MTRTPTGRTPRVRSLLLAVAALMISVPVAGSEAQPKCAIPNRITALDNPAWDQIAAPTFPAGPAEIRAYAVSPHDPELLYVTNGISVVRSPDGGCTFDVVFRLADVGLNDVTSRITSIVVPESYAGRRRVYLTAVEAGEGVGRPHVIRSDSGSRGEYAISDDGLPPVGTPGDLRIAPKDAAWMYLTLRGVPGVPSPVPGLPTPGPTGAVYRSADGGATWAAAGDATDFANAAAIDDLGISHASSAALWVIAGGRLRRSTDGGATYTDSTLPVSEQQAQQYNFKTVAVTSSRVVAFSAPTAGAGARAVVSTDGGRTFSVRSSPGDVRSVGYYRHKPDELAIGTVGPSGIFRYVVSAGQWKAMTPRGASTTGDFGVTVDRLRENVHGFTPTAVFRTRPLPGTKNLPPVVVPPIDPGDPPIAPARLLPAVAQVRMEIGQTREVPYVLDLPRRPTSLDVFLVIDNSGSMASFIADVKKNLSTVVDSLVASGVNLHVGLSYYQTTQDPPIYRRLVNVSRPTGELLAQFAQIKADSKGRDEAVLVALEQVATGKGMEGNIWGPLAPCATGIFEELEVDNPAVEAAAPCRIKPGQQADFRPKSLRVVLHATTERFDRPLPDIEDEDEPSFEDVAAAFNARGIEHIGIAAAEEPKENLKRLGRMTGTLASGPIDCDQDGLIDVPRGAPIVCPDTGKLSKTLVDVLEAVRDEQPVRFHSPSQSPVFGGLTPDHVPTVNVKQHNALRFKARFSCVNVAPGTYEVKLGAELLGADVANATALVTCGAPVVPAAVDAPNGPNVVQRQVNQPVQPAAAPPIVQPVPQAQVQPQANPNPQAGSATEEEETPQLAVASNDINEEGEQTLAMLGLGLSAAMTAAAGSVLGKRSRDRAAAGLATVRSGRRVWDPPGLRGRRR